MSLFQYQKINRFFAQIADGLTEIASLELAELGATNIQPVYRGLHFAADLKTLYRINYQSRLCSKITAALITFDCHSTNYLYKTAVKMPWHEFINETNSFSISATVVNSAINNSQYAALCLKDAIVDYFRNKTGSRPNVDRRTPDLWLDLYIANNKAVISLDTSGGSLHRRGYRKESVEAPMQEILAAAIVRLSGWDGSKTLIDPMCGSGTLLTEALMHYCHIPAGFLRKRFGFEIMPDFNRKVWQKLKQDCDDKIRTPKPGLICGSDIDDRAIQAARTNLKVLRGGGSVELTVKPFNEIQSISDAVIICNPPYGLRMNNESDMPLFMKDLGDFLKRKCTGSTAWLYLGKRELLKSVGLRTAMRKPLKTGRLDGVLAKFELY